MSPSVAAGFGLGLLLLAAGLPADGAAAAAVKACSRPIVFTSDHESFRQAGRDARPARLSALVAATRQRFNAAARRLCAAGILRPADLTRLGRVVVQNGEGATEPLIYREDGPARDFIFQYAFQDGGPPEAPEFEQALRCWKRPRGPGCEFGD